MKLHAVQMVLGTAFIAGAVVIAASGRADWGWLVLGAFLCIPGCVA